MNEHSLEVLKTIWPAITSMFILISAIFVAIGWYFIIQRNKAAKSKDQAALVRYELLHENNMFIGAIFATVFFILYLTRIIVFGSTMFGGPDSLKTAYYSYLVFHILLATIAAAFGLTSLTLAYKKNFVKHRKIGKVTAILWFAAAVTGVAVYALLYFIYTPGEGQSIFEYF